MIKKENTAIAESQNKNGATSTRNGNSNNFQQTQHLAKQPGPSILKNSKSANNGKHKSATSGISPSKQPLVECELRSNDSIGSFLNEATIIAKKKDESKKPQTLTATTVQNTKGSTLTTTTPKVTTTIGAPKCIATYNNTPVAFGAPTQITTSLKTPAMTTSIAATTTIKSMPFSTVLTSSAKTPKPNANIQATVLPPLTSTASQLNAKPGMSTTLNTIANVSSSGLIPSSAAKTAALIASNTTAAKNLNIKTTSSSTNKVNIVTKIHTTEVTTKPTNDMRPPTYQMSNNTTNSKLNVSIKPSTSTTSTTVT